jgi:hypothetical protein
MAKKPPPDTDLDPVTVGHHDPGGRVAMFQFNGRPVMLPERMLDLTPEQLELCASLEAKMVDIAAAQRDLASLVDEARALGLSWDTVGWCIGRTGRAASLRFG